MHDFQRSARWTAIAAVGGLLVWQSVGMTVGAAFAWSVLFCGIYAVAVFAAMFLLAPDGWRYIERHADLLVPLGLWAGALGLLEWLSRPHIGLATPLFTLPLGFLNAPISVGWVLKILITALFATWMTVLVVDVVRRDRADLAATLPDSKRLYPRMLVLLCLGWSLSTLLYAAEIATLLALTVPIGQVFGRLGVVVIWMLLGVVLAYRFAINLATAALLPIAVESRQGFWATLRRGISESWRNRKRWWKLLLVQYVLMGAWAAGHYQYAHSGNAFRSHTDFNFNFRYCVPWLGDYAYQAQRYTEAMKWVGQEPLALVVTLTALLGGLLSIVVKLEIFQRYVSAIPVEETDDLDSPAAQAPDEP